MTYGTTTESLKRVPPGPGLPPAVQALKWIGRPYEFLRECGQQFGDVFTLDFGPQGKYTAFSHPDAVRSIFTAEVGALHVGPGNAVLRPLLGPGSLLLLEGERHLRERRMLLPAFHNKVIANYGGLILEALRAATHDWSDGFVFVAQEVLQSVSVDVILRAVFGLRAGSLCAELKRELVALLNDRRLGLGLLARLGESDPDAVLEAFQKRLERVSQLTKDLVTDRRTHPSDVHGDMLSMLLDAKDENGQGRSDEALRDELLTLVATGHETTATALAWGLYWTSKHGHVRERIRKEIATLGPNPDPNAYTQLEYLDATCKEILRIYPIVPSVFRQVAERPFRVMDYVFEPGEILSPSIYLTHHREDLYPDPDAFEPDRFLRRTYSPYEYLPFGGGVRRCIGMSFALYETKVILARLLGAYDLEVASDQDVVPCRRTVTMAPSGGPRVTVKKVRS